MEMEIGNGKKEMAGILKPCLGFKIRAPPGPLEGRFVVVLLNCSLYRRWAWLLHCTADPTTHSSRSTSLSPFNRQRYDEASFGVTCQQCSHKQSSSRSTSPLSIHSGYFCQTLHCCAPPPHLAPQPHHQPHTPPAAQVTQLPLHGASSDACQQGHAQSMAQMPHQHLQLHQHAHNQALQQALQKGERLLAA